jgi:hypothetical protein
MGNDQIQLNIEESILDYCDACQTEEGTGVTGFRTHRSLPLDTHWVKVEFLNSKLKPVYIKYCADCLVKAKLDGLHVKVNGEYWDGTGMGLFFRYESSELGKIFNTTELGRFPRPLTG